MSYLPKQRTSIATKFADGKQNIKDSLDYFIGQAKFQRSVGRYDYQTLYDAYNGHIKDTQYKHVLNPNNAPEEALLGNPAELRNYPIIKPVVDLFLGEKRKRPRGLQVNVLNEDAEAVRKQAMEDAMEKLAQKKFAKSLADKGLAPPMNEDLPPAVDAAEKFSTQYNDERAIQGQTLMDWALQYNEVPEELQLCFFDYQVAGEAYSYKTLRHGNVVYENVPPMELDYGSKASYRFVEDTPWQVRRTRMTVSQLIDKFYDKIPKDLLAELENGSWAESESKGTNAIWQTEVHIDSGVSGATNQESLGRMVYVYHCTYKTFVKIGILDYTDELGMPQKMEVDEDYKLNPENGDVDIEWVWVNRLMEGYRVNDERYFGLDFVEIDRSELNNLSLCKSPYNGLCYSNRFSDNVSIVSIGIPYQKKVNEYNYSLDTTLSKNNDIALMVDISTIPKQKGWSVDKFLYYLKKMGIAFVNTAQDGASKTFNQYSALQMSTMQYVKNTYDLIQAFRDEYEEVVGITKPRKGQKEGNQGLGMMQSSIVSSSNITEEMFAKFDKFEEREAQGILDLAKWSDLEGKRGQYFNSDERQMFLDIEPETVQESQYGVVVRNAGEERAALDMFKQQAISFAQNGATPSMIAKIISAKHMPKITQLMEQVEESRERVMQAQQKAEQDAMIQAQQIAKETEQTVVDSNLLITELNNERAIEVALISANARSNGGDDAPDDKSMDANQQAQLMLKQAEMRFKERQENNRQSVENYKLKQGDRKLELEQQKITAMKNRPTSSSK